MLLGAAQLAGRASLSPSDPSKETATGAPALKAFLTFLAANVLSQFYRAFPAAIAPELSPERGFDPRALGDLQTLWIAGFVASRRRSPSSACISPSPG